MIVILEQRIILMEGNSTYESSAKSDMVFRKRID